MDFSGIFSRTRSHELSRQPGRCYFARLRNLALLWLMHDFDFSAEEVVDLRWSALNLNNGRLCVRNKETGRETVFWLDADALKILKKWRDYQARSTFYKALEHVFTNIEGQSLNPCYVRVLLFGLIVYTFLPINFLPIARADFDS